MLDGFIYQVHDHNIVIVVVLSIGQAVLLFQMSWSIKMACISCHGRLTSSSSNSGSGSGVVVVVVVAGLGLGW